MSSQDPGSRTQPFVWMIIEPLSLSFFHLTLEYNFKRLFSSSSCCCFSRQSILSFFISSVSFSLVSAKIFYPVKLKALLLSQGGKSGEPCSALILSRISFLSTRSACNALSSWEICTLNCCSWICHFCSRDTSKALKRKHAQ